MRGHNVHLIQQRRMFNIPAIQKQSSKDPGMPRDLQEQCAQCIEQMTCQSPTGSLNASDAEGEDGDKEGATEGEAEWDALLDVLDCILGLMELLLREEVIGRKGDLFEMCSV